MEIKNDSGLSLLIDAGQALTVEQASGWLADEKLPGAFSYPISAPLNEQNERFLQYAWRPNAARPAMVIAVNVRLEGVLYRRCLFSYRIYQGKIDGYLKIDGGEAWDSLRGKALGDVLPATLHLGDGIFSGTYVSYKDRLKQIALAPVATLPYTFFPIRNELQFEEEFTKDKLAGFVRTGYLNNWDRFDFLVDTGAEFGHLISPQFYLVWVLEQIFTAAGYRLAGDFPADPEIRRLTILNLTGMAQQQGFNALAGNIIFPAKHLPDLSVSDFLKVIKARFGLIYSFNATERICTIRRYVDAAAVRQIRQNWKAFQLAGYGIEEPAGKGYTVEEYLDPNDELYKIPDTSGNLKEGTPRRFVIGAGAEPVSLQVGTTNVTYITTPYDASRRWMVPFVRQAGNMLDIAYSGSDRYARDGRIVNPVGFRLLSYRGMVPDSAGTVYPLGTPDVRDGRQDVISQTSIDLAGRYGGWSKGLRLYYHFLNNTRKVTTNLLLPAQALSVLQLHEPVQLELDNQLASYLPLQVQAEAPGTGGRLKTNLEALTIPAALDLSDETYPDPVWVEWVQTLTGYENIRIDGISGVQRRSTITVKFWKERAKLTPVSVSSLLLRVRKKVIDRANGGLISYETIVPYRGNGTSTVLENDQAIERTLVATNGASPVNYVYSFALEPADEYNII